MSPSEDNNVKINRTRRHFLGLASATSAKVAMIGTLAATTVLPPSLARALGRKLRDKGGGHGGNAMCMLRGTAIMTAGGEVCIENLKIGDLVQTVSGQTMPIRWIGRNSYKRTGPTWNSGVMPIRISRHALGEGTPYKDLYLSPGHALYIDGVFMRATELVNGTSIAPALPAELQTIEYFQILLDTHQAILAEGAAIESFLITADNYEGFANFAEFERLFPQHPYQAMTPFAPFAGYGGRAHLKALLRLGASRFTPLREPPQDIYERIAIRALQLLH